MKYNRTLIDTITYRFSKHLPHPIVTSPNLATMQQTAAIIGSGMAGMAAAIRLAVQGYDVTVFEANSYPGGKVTELHAKGYRFDAGPSLFTLPQLVDELFTLTGKDPRQYFKYKQLPVITKYFYPDGTVINAYKEPTDFAQEIQRQTGEPAENVMRFLAKSKELYDLTAHIFLFASLHQWNTYLNLKALKTSLKLHKLDAFRSVDKANKGWFKDARVVQLFNRYATYNGSDPYQAPATLNIIPHLEHNIGAYLAQGGMHSVTKALYQLALEVGVKFEFGAAVSKIVVEGKRSVGVEYQVSSIKYREFDIIVSNMDVVNTYRKLLPNLKEPTRITHQPRSSSAMIFYWGIKKQFPQLDVHNILFAKDYPAEFKALFTDGTVYHDPTTYIYISSKENPTDAPEGCENWFVMVNAPNNTGQDWEALRQTTRKNILAKLKTQLGEDIEPLIETEDVLDPVLIEQRTSSYQGSLYGSSSNNMFAAFLRHANYSSQLSNLHFCGGSAHPGGGIPLCLLSGRIVADLVQKRHQP
jgi:phytoene desaturase